MQDPYYDSDYGRDPYQPYDYDRDYYEPDDYPGCMGWGALILIVLLIIFLYIKLF